MSLGKIMIELIIFTMEIVHYQQYTTSSIDSSILILLCSNVTYQRWSRGPKARGQGQEHQKNPRPRRRTRTAFPRTEPLEAKDRNARGQDQGPRTQAQAFSKKQGLQKFFSGELQFIGVPRTYDWGRPKPQIT